jgi:type 2 lantibiotic biosynthesis protein LanM
MHTNSMIPFGDYLQGFMPRRSTLPKALRDPLERHLLRQLSTVGARALQAEFAAFRAKRGIFAPEPDSDSTYRDFVKSLNWFLYQQYPLLSSRLRQTRDQWRKVTSQLATRLNADNAELYQTFGFNADTITHITPGLSDPHNGGQTVMIFEDGGGVRVVYKPRSLAVDLHFGRVLEWLNQYVDLPLNSASILTRVDYGWMEYVSQQQCNDEQQVQHFYTRAGTLLGLLYLFGSSDMHYENLIAHGEHPILIDLETLLTPQLGRQFTENENVHILNDTVLGVGFVNSSVHNGAAALFPPNLKRRVLHWEHINTDAMSISWRTVPFDQSANVCLLNGVPTSVREHSEAVIAGFLSALNIVQQHEEEFISRCITPVREMPVRLILRNTHVYTTLLETADEPRFLRDKAARDAHFAALHAKRFGTGLDALLAFERAALLRGDVPIFTVAADTHQMNLEVGRHSDNVPLYNAYSAAVGRIRQLTVQRRKREVAYIRMGLHPYTDVRERQLPNPEQSPVDRTLFVKRATALHNQITMRERRDQFHSTYRRLTWIDRVADIPTIINEELYSGTIGIALFRAALYKITGAAKRRIEARRITNYVRRRLRNTPAPFWKQMPLGITGLGGVVYGLSKIADFLNDDLILESAFDVAAMITPERIAADRTYDVIGGAAGALVGLRALPDQSIHIRETVSRLRDHLLDHRADWKHGGMAHGDIGICYALQETVMPPLIHTDEVGITFSTSWCRGAAGHAIATGNLADLGPVLAFNNEALCVDQLCCGNLGRVEAILTLGLRHNRADLVELAQRKGMQIVRMALENREYAGVWREYAGKVGFFQGWSGIGYTLLRLAYPDQLPSVLAFE